MEVVRGDHVCHVCDFPQRLQNYMSQKVL